MPLKRKGDKAWARCPFHGEKTASLCLYEDPARGWVCFGCHKGGDAVTLYSEYYHIGRFEAARQLASDFGVAVSDVPVKSGKRRPAAHNLRRALEKRRDRDYARLCDALHAANSILERYHNDTAWDNPRFLDALRARCAAEERLDRLQTATVPELAQFYINEVKHIWA